MYLFSADGRLTRFLCIPGTEGTDVTWSIPLSVSNTTVEWEWEWEWEWEYGMTPVPIPAPCCWCERGEDVEEEVPWWATREVATLTWPPRLEGALAAVNVDVPLVTPALPLWCEWVMTLLLTVRIVTALAWLDDGRTGSSSSTSCGVSPMVSGMGPSSPSNSESEWDDSFSSVRKCLRFSCEFEWVSEWVCVLKQNTKKTCITLNFYQQPFLKGWWKGRGIDIGQKNWQKLIGHQEWLPLWLSLSHFTDKLHSTTHAVCSATGKFLRIYLPQQSQNLGESHPVPAQALPTEKYKKKAEPPRCLALKTRVICMQCNSRGQRQQMLYYTDLTLIMSTYYCHDHTYIFTSLQKKKWIKPVLHIPSKPV